MWCSTWVGWVWLQIRIMVHYAAHHGFGFVHMIQSLHTCGLLWIARRYTRVVPFGTSRPLLWTPHGLDDPSLKWDAIPTHILEMLIPRSNCGRRRGTSLFITPDTPDRAQRKLRYVAALSVRAIREEYVPWIREVCTTTVPAAGGREYADRFSLRLCVRITWRLHTGVDPTPYQEACSLRVCDAITHSLHHIGTRYVDRERDALREGLCRRGASGFVRRWREAGMCDDDIFVEFMHNLFGMTLQWASLIMRLLCHGKIDTIVDAVHFVLDDPPAQVATSRSHGRFLVHDLRDSSHVRRPVHVEGVDPPIVTDAAYLPFGKGARRCPGEYLTYEFLRCASVALERHELVWRREYRMGVRNTACRY